MSFSLAIHKRQPVHFLAVKRAVKDHVAELIELLKELNEQLARETDKLARSAIEADIRAANMAITHYQLALELEEQLKSARKSK